MKLQPFQTPEGKALWLTVVNEFTAHGCRAHVVKIQRLVNALLRGGFSADQREAVRAAVVGYLVSRGDFPFS